MLSFWYYNEDELRLQITCTIKEKEKNSDNEIQHIRCTPGESMVIDGEWSLVETKFRVKKNDDRITVFLNGDGDSEQEIFVDDLLIRPASVNVYIVELNQVYKNTIGVTYK